MRLSAVPFALLAFVPLPGLANDTAAVLSTGGLEFVIDQDIVMVSEDLYISTQEIRVSYVFRNDGAADRSVLVAFPMPDIVADHFSPVGYPPGPDDNIFEFETRFNGAPVAAELHQYAYAVGVDRTQLLRKLGVPLVPFSPAAIDALGALAPADQERLARLGLVFPEQVHTADGWVIEYYPAWMLRATYTWEAVFPAGENVLVEHRYTPSVGGTSMVSFLAEPYGDYDPAADYADRYCTDEAFLSALRRTLVNGDPWTAPFAENWLSYVLTTGANWNGPIGTFRLVVDKGRPENLVSFCGEDVTKIGPTTFEMVKTDFWPGRDLEILVLQRHEGWD